MSRTTAQQSGSTEITFPHQRNLQTLRCYLKLKHLFLSVDLQILIVQFQFSVLHTVNEFVISPFAVFQPDKKIKVTVKFKILISKYKFKLRNVENLLDENYHKKTLDKTPNGFQCLVSFSHLCTLKGTKVHYNLLKICMVPKNQETKIKMPK